MSAATTTNDVSTTFTCSTCERQWRKNGDHSHRTPKCPQCQNLLAVETEDVFDAVILPKEQAADQDRARNSLPSTATGHDQSRTQRAPLPVPVWAAIAGIPVAMAMMGMIALFGLLVVSNIACSVNPTITPKPINQTALLTKKAWDTMQSIDNDLRAKQFAKASQRYRAVSVQYSQVNLSGVDQKLASHYQEVIALHTQAAVLFEKIEADFGTLNSNAETVGKIGEAIGAFASDDDTRERTRGIMGIVGRMVGEASQSNARKNLKAQYLPQVQELEKRFNALNAKEVALAKSLSATYDQQFIDLF